jgi:uncharacterized LabA/DUF88 family protein
MIELEATMAAERATIFVDGNNFYHGLKRSGATGLGNLDFARIALKLCGPRTWVELRYYVGQIPQTGNTQLYADQRSFVARQQKRDARISFHFGRLEPRKGTNEAAEELSRYLAGLKVRLDPDVYRDLSDLARQHRNTSVMVEKAVDVMLAVDLVILAEQDKFDTAYVVSADGDYTHAVKYVRSLGKKVFAVAATNGYELKSVVNSFIRIDASWVNDCYC